MFYVKQLEQYQVNDLAFHKMFELWWSDFQEAGIEALYVAFSDDHDVVGFMTTNKDNLCVAIEVREAYRNKRVGTLLCEFSGCFKTERNDCPEFWGKVSNNEI